MERSCKECFGRHLMHLIWSHMRQPVPQPTSRLVGLVHLVSGDVDEYLAFCSY